MHLLSIKYNVFLLGTGGLRFWSCKPLLGLKMRVIAYENVNPLPSAVHLLRYLIAMAFLVVKTNSPSR
jgi:hypothetical protein